MSFLKNFGTKGRKSKMVEASGGSSASSESSTKHRNLTPSQDNPKALKVKAEVKSSELRKQPKSTKPLQADHNIKTGKSAEAGQPSPDNPKALKVKAEVSSSELRKLPKSSKPLQADHKIKTGKPVEAAKLPNLSENDPRGRNMSISRSGRHKERSRTRLSVLPNDVYSSPEMSTPGQTSGKTSGWSGSRGLAANSF